MPNLYGHLIGPHRAAFAQKIADLYQATHGVPSVVAQFLLNYCSLGVQMTESVPDWIRRAGERCVSLGFTDAGNALISHAAHEEGHHLLMINDTRSLVSWLNSKGASLDADSYLNQPDTKGVTTYKSLHEANISGETPYGQIAIEYEIERISVEHGPNIVGYCAQTLGAEVLNCLSFIQDHMAFDIGHTKYNAAILSKLLVDHPDSLNHLVEAGKNALDAYASYLGDCLEKAKSVVV